MTHILTIPLLVLLAMQALAAAPDSESGVSIRLFAAALNQNQGPVQILVGDTRSDAFNLTTTTLTQSKTLSARAFRLISADSTAASAPQTLATINLPEQGSDFRVILVPSENNIYRHIIIRGDEPKFSNGDIFFINLSSSRMLGMLGTVRFDLKPGVQQIMSPTGNDGNNFFEVKFARHVEDKDKLLPLTNTCWPVVRDNRSFVIFYDNRSGRPSYRAVDEFMPIAAQ